MTQMKSRYSGHQKDMLAMASNAGVWPFGSQWSTAKSLEAMGLLYRVSDHPHEPRELQLTKKGWIEIKRLWP